MQRSCPHCHLPLKLPPPERTCKQCGVVFRKERSFIFCSKQCSNDYRRLQLLGGFPSFKGALRECKNCGKAYMGKTICTAYCSNECRDNLYIKACLICEGPIKKKSTVSVPVWSRGKTCSLACKKALQGRERLARRVEKDCKNCDGKFLVNPSDTRIFCSHECSHEGRRVQITPEELMEASKIAGGRAGLARKYNVHAGIITRRMREVGIPPIKW